MTFAFALVIISLLRRRWVSI